MMLATALGAENCRVISIIGAGGKTSLMFRLAAEFAAAGKHVVTTTTTHIMTPGSGESRQLLVAEDLNACREQIGQLLVQHHHLTVAAKTVNKSGKLRGFAPEVIDWLAGLACVDVVIVEADGAFRKTLKASAAHEPVVPLSTGLLICVCGLDGLGRKIADTVFRPELYAKATERKPADKVTPQSLATMLRHDLSRIAAGASYRQILVLNKADDAHLGAIGVQVAEAVLAADSSLFSEIFLTSLADSHAPLKKRYRPAHKKHRYPVAGIILAAGRSSRMEKTKLLLPFGESTVLQKVVDSAAKSSLDTVLVVLGHESEEITRQTEFGSFPVVENHHYRTGQASSLQAGIDALPETCQYALFFLGDQPLIKPATIDLLVAEAQRTGPLLIAPCHDNRRGNPVMVHRSLFPAIHELTGDIGARPLLEHYRTDLLLVVVDDPGILLDIDTAEDYRNLLYLVDSPEK